MAISERSDLFVVLDRGDRDAILGTPESEWLDFKQQPYRLNEDDQKLELAKDVTAIANSGGGVIVIGFDTRRDAVTAREIASEISPVRQDLVNADQYRRVVEDLTYPPIRNLTLRWWLVQDGAGVLTIEIPAAVDADAPVLVVRAREAGSRRDLLLGVFERTVDRVSRITPSEIHAQIHLGRLLRGIGLSAPSAISSPPAGPSEEERRQRLDSDARDSGLLGHRRYFLQAWPLTQTEVQGMHRLDGVRTVLSRPPVLRYGGFNLQTRVQPSVIPGGGLRVVVESQMSISLQRNGLLTWVVTADSGFLAWGRPNWLPHTINPLALVESTLELVRLFVNEVLPRCQPQPIEWSVAGGMADLREQGEPSFLIGGRAREFIFPDEVQEAPSGDITINPLTIRTESPGQVAFRILKEVYAQFGIDESQIPYTQNGEVSEQLIQQVR